MLCINVSRKRRYDERKGDWSIDCLSSFELIPKWHWISVWNQVLTISGVSYTNLDAIKCKWSFFLATESETKYSGLIKWRVENWFEVLITIMIFSFMSVSNENATIRKKNPRLLWGAGKYFCSWCYENVSLLSANEWQSERMIRKSGRISWEICFVRQESELAETATRI